MASVLKRATVGHPEVSFVVIAFNERDRAPHCLRSILAQDAVVPFEIIVVDDGSTDGMSSVLLEEFGQEQTLTLLALAENQGRGAARAAGVDAAEGRLVAFVDSDISLPSDWLRTCLDALPGHVAVGGIPVPDGDCEILYRRLRLEARPRPGTAGVTGSNVLFDGDSLRRIGVDASSRLGEDFRLAKRLASSGRTMAVIPGLTVHHEESRTYRQSMRWLYDSGVDATRLLVEFGEVRVPDAAWGLWLLVSAAGVSAAFGRSRAWLLAPAAVTTAIAAGHVGTRFAFASAPARTSAAVVADVPLVGAYLVGRTVGLARLGLSRRARARTRSLPGG